MKNSETKQEKNDHDVQQNLFLKMTRGPKGLGDPEDRTLRKVETEVLIPKLVRERSKALKCSEFKKAFDNCCLENALAMVYKCREENRLYQQCLNKWFFDKDFVDECKELYLKQRSEFRSTGIKHYPTRNKSQPQQQKDETKQTYKINEFLSK